MLVTHLGSTGVGDECIFILFLAGDFVCLGHHLGCPSHGLNITISARRPQVGPQNELAWMQS